MRRLLIRFIPLIVFAVLALFLWRGLSLEPQKLPSTQIGQKLVQFAVPQLLDERQLFSPKLMRGQVSLLNVWASWCGACVEEQVFLLQLARQGMPIYGLNYKDDPWEARHWLKEWGNPFQVVGEDRKGLIAIDLGVYGAPETFLVDAKGIVRYRHVGILDEQSWQNEFLPRIAQLEQTE